MLNDFSGKWDFDPDYAFTDPEMERLREIIRMAMFNGEVLSIRYHAGTTPGSIREFFPFRLTNSFTLVQARCLRSHAVKTFSLKKIELIGEYPELCYKNALKENSIKEWFNLLIPNQRLPLFKFSVPDKDLTVYEIVKGKLNPVLKVSDHSTNKKEIFTLDTSEFSKAFNNAGEAIRFMIYMLETSKLSKEKIKKKKKTA